ncbi:hypothetical protein PQZ39_01095 [bacterium]|nr:hypothetical protein [bacterium]
MYYPKSQVKVNLFTQGGELIKARDKSFYSGHYYSTSKGEYFSGKTPNDPLSEKLIPFSNANFTPNNSGEIFDEDNTYISNQSYYNARKLEDRSSTPRNPISSIPSSQVSERYFVSKTNEIRFIEVSKTEYQKFKNKSPEVNWSLFEPIKIPWRTKGKRDEVYLENKTNVLKQNIPGFELFFKGKYDKFWESK